ncbi:bifunctional DNA-formamidopyrimidine glycosylase/DNA-(apurinic or apyrimidinic site) lyase [Leucobacter sp. GX24907]
MPELPEVEVVRAGLAPALTGARVVAVEVRDPRALKRHEPRDGSAFAGGHGVTLSPEAGRERAGDFERRLTGAVLGTPVRRGKFMWVPIDQAAPESGIAIGTQFGAPSALLAHLGMSGQMLLRSHEAPDDRHVRVRLWIEHPIHRELRIDFADQRLFGSLAIDELIPTDDGAPGGWGGLEMLTAETARGAMPSFSSRESVASLIPAQARHIARDALDPAFDDARFAAALRSRTVSVKTVLLDQRQVSGVGNIYADEALWRARLHPELPGLGVGPRKARELLLRVREVFGQALAEGGTSFDEQYVNVNGEAGYFAHSLHAYGRTGDPCDRCAEPLRRMMIGGRSSHFCARCQRKRSS